MRFADPGLLLLLVVLPLLFVAYLLRRPGRWVQFSSVRYVKGFAPSLRVVTRHIVFVLRCGAIGLLVLGFARPQKGIEQTKVTTEGIDIELAIDISGSMRARDFQIGGRGRDRLYVVKQVVNRFIRNRQSDRIGLVVFSRYPYTQCPLTLDYGVLLNLLDKAEIGMIEDGTAIGTAIGTATARLKDSEAKSKVIILLTDGVDNASKIDPETAAQAAKALGIRIYTIGAGSKGKVPYPFTDMLGREVLRTVEIKIDDERLTRIAEITGGKYFRATDTESLEKIYDEIDRMEKTTATVEKYSEYRELFPYFVVPALALILLETVLAGTVYRKIP
jgi:Ca-activated chloride channel family protein